MPSSLNVAEAKGNKATITIGPCYPGYGVTLGNALRRVLLSSLEGSAITAFKVKGANHEFSSLPGVKEDLVEIILNLKKVRVKSFSDEPVKLNLSVKGEKEVTAGDMDKNAEVEIMSSYARILTLTDKNAEVEMEITVNKGRGYVTVEDRAKEKIELGTISIDAIYSPVVSVGFEIENVRVGDRTDFDRLVLKLETDGSLSPKEAISQASDILVKHFSFVLNGGEQETDEEAAGRAETAEQASEPETIKEEKPKAVKTKRGRPKKEA